MSAFFGTVYIFVLYLVSLKEEELKDKPPQSDAEMMGPTQSEAGLDSPLQSDAAMQVSTSLVNNEYKLY